MKTSLKSLLALAAFGATALFTFAQPAQKIAICDLGKVFESHYKTTEQQEKLKGQETKINEQISQYLKEGQSKIEKYKELVEQTKNPVLTAEARTAAETDANRQLEEVRRMEQEFNEYRQQANAAVQQQIGAFREQLIGEISKIATDVAKRKGANILLERSPVIYLDPAFDITDEVIAEINKTRPAGAAAAPAATPAANGTSTESPSVVFPGARK